MLVNGRVRIYYGGSPTVHRGWKRNGLVCLATLRPDGFAGYEPSVRGQTGILETRPLVCTGAPLRVTADAQGGQIRVTAIDAKGFECDGCEPISSDVTDAKVTWRTGVDFAALKGKTVRLRFELKDAKLYAFSGLELPTSSHGK